MGTKRTNTLAGTIRRGSVKHVIYEAMMAHKSNTFCSKDIYDQITKKRPDIQMQTVQNMVGFIFVKMKIVNRTDRVREAENSGRKLKIYERNAKAKQPIVREKGIGPAKQPKRKYTRKTKVEAPTLTALEMGESMIDYINHLQERVGELAVDYDKALTSFGDEKRAHQKTKDSMQYKLTELEKANEALKKQVAQRGSGRTFNTESVLDFKKRKAETHGV